MKSTKVLIQKNSLFLSLCFLVFLSFSTSTFASFENGQPAVLNTEMTELFSAPEIGTIASEILPPRLKRYKIELYSLRCLEEDDPGGEIEIYGSIKARISYTGRDRRVRRYTDKKLWSRNERRPFEMDEHETYYRKGAVYFSVSEADLKNGKISINLAPSLFEDDGSSGDDTFKINHRACSNAYNSWKYSDRLNRIKTIIFVEGDTRLEVKWKVTEVR